MSSKLSTKQWWFVAALAVAALALVIGSAFLQEWNNLAAMTARGTGITCGVAAVMGAVIFKKESSRQSDSRR